MKAVIKLNMINSFIFDSCRYIFKRLRFLGNKNLSHFLTLMFLALWHGLFVGYFVCFLGEFVIMVIEKQASHWLFVLVIELKKKNCGAASRTSEKH